MRKKQFYEAPDAELLVIGYEESFLTGTYKRGGGGYYDDDETNDNGEY